MIDDYELDGVIDDVVGGLLVAVVIVLLCLV